MTKSDMIRIAREKLGVAAKASELQKYIEERWRVEVSAAHISNVDCKPRPLTDRIRALIRAVGSAEALIAIIRTMDTDNDK